MPDRDRQANRQSVETPLQGWKEIASYLERDPRTAQRWETALGLPVRRHGGSTGSVYAYPSELDAWRAARPPQSQSDSPPVVLWRRPQAWVALGVVSAATLAISYGPILNPRDPVAEAADESMRTEQVWTGAEAHTTSSLSSHGKWLIYTNWPSGDLWFRDVVTGEDRQITNKGDWIENRSFPETAALSPDGKRLAAGWYNDDIGYHGYELRVGPVPAPGETDNGAMVPQTAKAGYVEVVGWLSDSQVLFVRSSERGMTRLVIADVDRDTITVLKTFDWKYPGDAAISPDRRWIAYELEDDIYVLAADGSSESIVVEHPAEDAPVEWTPDGSHLLFRSTRTSDQSLWALPVHDGKRGGRPRLVSPEFSALGSLGMSPDGDLYYLKRTGSLDVYEARIDVVEGKLIAKPEPITATFVGDNFAPVYSPDGRWMAYLSNRNLGRRYDSTRIVLRDLETGEERDLAPTLPSIRSLAWTPDSSALLFRAKNDRGRFGVYRIGLADSDEEQLLFRARKEGQPVRGRNLFWMPDGRSVHYRDRYGPGGIHWIHDLETGDERKVLTGKGHSIMTSSPDGSRFSVMEHLRGESVTYLFTVDAQTGRRRELWRMKIPDGRLPPQVTAWTPDGATILFWRRVPHTEPTVTELWTVPANGGEARRTDLSAEDPARPDHTLSLHRDGERIAFSAGNPKHEIWKLSNFLDRLGGSD